jgi:hypothetical protein
MLEAERSADGLLSSALSDDTDKEEGVGGEVPNVIGRHLDNAVANGVVRVWVDQKVTHTNHIVR